MDIAYLTDRSFVLSRALEKTTYAVEGRVGGVGRVAPFGCGQGEGNGEGGDAGGVGGGAGWSGNGGS